MTQDVLLTGANGFVGRAVSRALLACGDRVTGIVRQPGSAGEGGRTWLSTGKDFVDVEQEWPADLRCDAVIHLAARVHTLKETAADPMAAYRETNVAGTLRVARAARAAGSRRFVFVSSIKAIAEHSDGQPLTERTPAGPSDPYGISKLEAERELCAYGAASGMEIVIVRPPLVYGPGVRANFFSLMNAIARGVPLPLGAIEAQRSLVYVETLADALIHCATDPRAAGQTFHVTDGQDLSVSELARILARHLHVPARLVRVPPEMLRLAGRLTGRSAQVERLVGELRVDSGRIRSVLGWSAPYTAEQGLRETASWFRATH
ncbi:NAD-dependent epimerase/dehydratase family protein [Paraburkholderia sp. Ac-20347]|uniref:NAD-dependent epimerase/dehydratase family protein n=1 Tax=Paraburkholderia sp. Ac-20347 TaxID=2703892 RepID=UPI00197FC518|nr:NAD-dependent epimerase/dehydratase family protein [Paraburkholderia sp. Ac-20347]MBN3808165.1 NAD-dependent epimerase/dehydratase family protein [Paraburkholderia sp. Ac-20347]